MVTSRRVRHGIVLALAGLLAGLGIVGALKWGGTLPQQDRTAAGDKVPALAVPTEGGSDAPGNRPQENARGAAGGAGPDAGPSGGARTDGAAQGTPGRDAAPKAGATKDGATKDGAGPDTATGDTAANGAVRKAADAPRFDIVRVEPNGDAVVAGRGKPNTVVEMLVDGKPVAKALADPNGQFAIVPPPLPKGSSEIVLRSRTADGQESRSPQSVAVSVSPKGDTQPLVALTAPDAPTVVLSQPGTAATPPAAPAAEGQATAGQAAPPAPGGQGGALRIVSVDAEPGGRLFVTGSGKPGTQVQLYLNDTIIAPGKVGTDGHVTFTIGRGVSGGKYQVRIDEVDPATGKVVHRAEVPFAMPRQVAEAGHGTRPSAASTAPVAGGQGAHGGANSVETPVPSPGQAKGEAGMAATGRSDATVGRTDPGTGRAEAGKGTGRDRIRQAGRETGREAGKPAPGAAGKEAGRADPRGGARASRAPSEEAMASPPASAGMSGAGAVFVPEIATARIIRGDNLWQISKRTYGRGERYTVIYDANQTQIRNPDLIYPGQIFVLPNDRRG